MRLWVSSGSVPTMQTYSMTILEAARRAGTRTSDFSAGQHTSLSYGTILAAGTSTTSTLAPPSKQCMLPDLIPRPQVSARGSTTTTTKCRAIRELTRPSRLRRSTSAAGRTLTATVRVPPAEVFRSCTRRCRPPNSTCTIKTARGTPPSRHGVLPAKGPNPPTICSSSNNEIGSGDLDVRIYAQAPVGSDRGTRLVRHARGVAPCHARKDR